MDHGNAPRVDAEGPVDHPEDGHRAVRGARGVGNDTVIRGQGTVVIPVYCGQVNVSWPGIRKEHSARACLNMALGVCPAVHKAGTVKNDIHPDRFPRELPAIRFGKKRDRVSADDHGIAASLNREMKPSVARIMPCQVYAQVMVRDIIHGNDCGPVAVSLFVKGAQHAPADSSISIDPDPYHPCVSGRTAYLFQSAAFHPQSGMGIVVMTLKTDLP